MMVEEDTKRRTRNLDQVTAWISPHYGMKRRLRRLHDIDHRQTESRITEDALLMYVPLLEQRLLPGSNDHRREDS